MRPIIVLVGMVVLAGTAAGWGQDLVVVAPGAAKVEFENARVRVVRLKMPAHTSSPMHDRPSRVVIPLTANDVRIVRDNGSVGTTRTAAGIPAWSEPAKRSVTNLASPLENVIVELKTAKAPARPAAHPPSPAPLDYLADRLHTWLFENQYVRVFDVRIPPGQTTDFHRRAYDSATIHLSGGLVAWQVQGGTWGAATKVDPGSAMFDADGGKSEVRRMRNEGTTEYHAIVVQLTVHGMVSRAVPRPYSTAPSDSRPIQF